MSTDDTTTSPSHAAVDRVEAALTAAGVEPRVRWLDEHATTAVDAARLLGIEVGAIANSLVFELDGQPLLVMTSGAHRVDTRWLGEQLGGTIHRAKPDAVQSATSQVIGGVAPVGHPAPLRTIVDADLARYDEIWAAAGHARTVFPLSFDQLVAITGGQVMPVAAPAD
ncbi:YbaK/EbsC family protein [Diaminobutyricimonas sp. TR449]|uniref:YbaK/EbsC family protein n=1 Tax=Diaminobutyricimonas sp. TR449 TaxID=2708076 RepID=UPI0014203572|nr:YbaK/EbsC family protein [Diaminobutyricimonas sp. TR449]